MSRTPRVSRHYLYIAQFVWVVLAVFSIGKFVLSEVVYYQGATRVCKAPVLDCHERKQLTAQDIASLKSDGISIEQWAIFNILYSTFNALVSCAIGFYIFARKRDDWAALITSSFLILFGTLGGYASFLAARYPEYRIWFGLMQFPAWIAFPLFSFTFPNGRMTPRPLWIIILFWSFYFLVDFLIPGVDKTSAWYVIFSQIAFISILASGAASQVYRYVWVSGVEERRQIKWVVAGVVAVVVLSFIAYGLPPFSQILDQAAPYSAWQVLLLAPVMLSVNLIPVSIGLAILRYRLWDIDVLIRRALIYSSLTIMLGLVYFGVITVSQALFSMVSKQQSPISVVLSTLIIAALFNPLRRWTQNFIDWRFYRRKYNLERTLAKFATTIYSETDPEQISCQLTAIAQETLEPEAVSLWLLHSRK